MYIQPTFEPPTPAVQIPADYAGTAFSKDEEREEPLDEASESAPTLAEAPDDEESVPAGATRSTAPKKGSPLSFLTSSPVFRSLLPPPRKGHAEGEDPWQWLLLGAALLLLFSDKGDDFLPLLLILLLWD